MLGEKHVSRIALCTAVFGVLGLLFFEQGIVVQNAKISSINDSMAGSPVKLNCLVESSFKKENTLFLRLYDGTGKIKAVLFSPKPEQAAVLQKGKFASVEGKVQLYEEELEVIIEKAEEWQ